MAIAEAAAELLPLLGRTGEFAKLGSESAVLTSIRNQLRNLVGAGLSIGEATNTLRNRNLPQNVQNTPNLRNNYVNTQNQSFISRVNQAATQNTLRQRRPLTEQMTPPITTTIPTPQPINRPIRIRRPTTRNVTSGAAIGTAAIGTGIGVATASNTGENVTVSNPTTPEQTNPDNAPLEHMPKPIRNNPTTNTPSYTTPLIPNTPIDTIGNILNQNAADIIYNPGLKGAYKYPKTYWDNEVASKYAKQTFFNAMRDI